MTSIRVLELFPQHLAVNGDMGNVRVLRERLRLADIESEHVTFDPGDAFPEEVDIVTVGTGPASALRVLAPVVAQIADQLRGLRDTGVPILAVTAGMQLLGDTVSLPGGDALSGAGVFSIATDAAAPRVVTNCFVVDTERAGRLVGIENHGSTMTLSGDASVFGTAVTGRGNGSSQEGVRQGSAVGTHIQGPVLAMNPILADELLSAACSRRGLEYVAGEAHETLDALALECRRILTDSVGLSVSGSSV